MKKVLLISIYFLFCIGCTEKQPCLIETDTYGDKAPIVTKANPVDSIYYWSSGKKIHLSVVPNKYFILFDESVNPHDDKLFSNLRSSDLILNPINSSLNNNETYFIAGADSDILDAYASNIVYSAPYLSNGAKEFGLTNIFYIKLKDKSDQKLLYDFAALNKVNVIQENILPLWFTLECTDQSTGNSLTLANLAYESKLFAASDVSFFGDIKTDALIYNDPMFSEQWNLTGTYGISYDGVPDISTGVSSVKVAVIDTGIKLDHPDLPLTMSFDATTGTSPGRLYHPSNPELYHHGTAMTGIIGAIPDNNIAIVGIAPNVSLLPISVDFNSNNTGAALVTAVRYAADNGSHIISNSWTADGSHQTLSEAFEYALERGCLILQSSGNSNTTTPFYPYADIPDVLVVGNSDKNGCRYSNPGSGSTYGPYLDIVAPGTDIPVFDADGTNRIVSGSSPSCAEVSAVAALMLSVNPDLTRQQVATILEKTARKLPEYDFSIQQNRPNGSWNEQVGYGLVDCFDAVMLAQELDESNYRTLVEFDYYGSDISMSINAKKDIAVIWDWGAQGISYISAGTSEFVSHTYSSGGVKNVVIAEYIAPGTSPTTLSTALRGFDLITGEDAVNFNFKMINKGLENIEIKGGQDFAAQEIVFSSLTGLKTLKLHEMKNASVRVSNCPNLTYLSNTRYIWGAPPITSSINEEDIVSPYVVGDGNTWPINPESVVSFTTLNISSCAKLHTLSLENVGFSTMSFANLPKLQYVYLTSKADKIVGAASNPLSLPTKGSYLKDAINTLPSRSGNSTGRVLLRCVSNDNASYIPVSISSSNYNAIMSSASNKNWNVVWESGIQY